jgi:hypothetical protein
VGLWVVAIDRDDQSFATGLVEVIELQGVRSPPQIPIGEVASETEVADHELIARGFVAGEDSLGELALFGRGETA